MTQTWQEREQRILQAIRDAEEVGEPMSVPVLVQRLGLDEQLVKLALQQLLEAGYVYADVLGAADDPMFVVGEIKLLERGLRAVDVWPSDDAYAELLAMLEARLDSEDEPEKRSQLKALLTGVRTAGRDVVVDLLKAWMRQEVGLGLG